MGCIYPHPQYNRPGSDVTLIADDVAYLLNRSHLADISEVFHSVFDYDQRRYHKYSSPCLLLPGCRPQHIEAALSHIYPAEPGIPISTSQEEWQLIFDFAYAFGFDSLWVAASRNLGRYIDPIDKIRIGRRRGYARLMKEGLEEFSKSSRRPPSPDSEDAKVIGYDGLCTIMEFRLRRSLTVTIPPPIVEVPRAGMSSQNDQRDRKPNPILSPVEAVYNSSPIVSPVEAVHNSNLIVSPVEAVYHPNQSVTISESITRVEYSPLLSSAATHRSFFLPGILHVHPPRPEWNERLAEPVDSRRQLTKISTPRIVEIDDLMETIVFDPATPVRPPSSHSVNFDPTSTGRRVARAAVRERTASFIHRSLAARQELRVGSDLNITRRGMCDQSGAQTDGHPEMVGKETTEGQHGGANAVMPISHAHGDALSSCASPPPSSSPPSSLPIAEADAVAVALETADHNDAPGADDPAVSTPNIHDDISMAHLPQSTPASGSGEIHPIVSSLAAANATLGDNFDTTGETSDIPEPLSSCAEGSGAIEPPPGEISPPLSVASLGSPSIPPNSNPSIPMVKTENIAVDRRHHLDGGLALGDVSPGHLSTQADSRSDNDPLPDLRHRPPESVHPENISLPPSPPVSQSQVPHSSQFVTTALTIKNALDGTKELDVFDEDSAVTLDPRCATTMAEIKSNVASTNNPNPNPSTHQLSPTPSTGLSPCEGQTLSTPFAHDSPVLSDKVPDEAVIVERAEAASIDEQDGGTDAPAKSQEGDQDHDEGLRMIVNVEAGQASDDIAPTDDVILRLAGPTRAQRKKQRRNLRKEQEERERMQRLVLT
ncbi:hypothetical protein HWV62_33831 [Athelia sp. TMB]|nr:hypothetical protein HWV62_33831 [Athelia sp. TMB]